MWVKCASYRWDFVFRLQFRENKVDYNGVYVASSAILPTHTHILTGFDEDAECWCMWYLRCPRVSQRSIAICQQFEWVQYITCFHMNKCAFATRDANEVTHSSRMSTTPMPYLSLSLWTNCVIVILSVFNVFFITLIVNLKRTWRVCIHDCIPDGIFVFELTVHSVCLHRKSNRDSFLRSSLVPSDQWFSRLSG